MSFSYDEWMAENSSSAISSRRRAIAAWRRIQRNPASITLVREDGTTLAAQTVRVVPENTRSSEDNADAGGLVTASTISVSIFGVRNHPTVADTDIQRGDQFRYQGDLYRVVNVKQYPGEAQASGEMVQ